MAKGFDTLHIKSAVKNHNKFNLDKTHLTTMDFGQIVPLYAEETIPGDKFNVQANYFSRTAPLVKPTYGKFSFKTATFFVPYHQIAYDAEAYMAGKTTWEGTTPDLRWIYYTDYVQFLLSNVFWAGSTSGAAYDFTYIDANGTRAYRTIGGPEGKYYLKVLNALGYSVPQNIDLSTGSTWYATFGDTASTESKLNALPLLAFAKAYNDYMSQSQRFNTSTLTNFLRCVKYNVSVNGYVPASHTLNAVGLAAIFSNIKLNYENDYFTSAWQSANNPLYNTENVQSAVAPGTSDNVVNGRVNTYAVLTDYAQNPGSANYLNQRTLDFLKDFDDWVRRNNYSGSRAVQQVYSRFGIKTDDYKSHYAQVITTDSMPISVGDVTAQASTTGASGATLGEYAGKAILSDKGGFSFAASDYGILLILGYFTIVPMNAYGFDRRVLRKSAFDYYTPEFDGLGAQAISYGELFSSPIVGASGTSISGDTTLDNGVYGFTERYNEYRYGRDVITGEFRNFRNRADMNTWHTGRLLSDVRKAGEMVAQSSSMSTLPQGDSEYNRIFSVVDGKNDHFYLTAQFNVSAVRPMLNLNQVPMLGEGDTNVPRNGNTIN